MPQPQPPLQSKRHRRLHKKVEKISSLLERSRTMRDDKSMDFTILFRALVKKCSEFEPFLETDRTAADASERNRKGIRNQSRLGKPAENVFDREFRPEFRIVQYIQARRRDRGDCPTTPNHSDSR